MTALLSHQYYLNDILDRQKRRRLDIDPGSKFEFPKQPEIASFKQFNLSGITTTSQGTNSKTEQEQDVAIPNEEEEEEALSKENVVNYVKEEETIRNDYSDWFGKSNDYSSNWILGADDHEICEEYPALKKLMNLKNQLVTLNSHAPLYLPLSSTSPTTIQTSLGNANKFDVILIHPLSSWEATSNLPIRQISSDPGFIFLWVGKSNEEGLERGRECFAKWGFRRAEDIVWVKTNKHNRKKLSKEKTVDGVEQDEPHTSHDGDDNNKRKRSDVENGSLFASQKEHCLMGIRGTVRRSTDMRFVHCNVDTDVMVWEGSDDPDSSALPPYLYTLIENFCLGTRRLELLPSSPKPRKGWVTATLSPLPPINPSDEKDVQVQPFDPNTYSSIIPQSDGRPVLPYHTEIDILRPKSPQRRPRNLPGGNNTSNNTGGRPSPNPSTSVSGFRPPNQNQNQNRQFNPRQQQQQQQQQQMQMQQQNMGMQGYNPNAQMNPMLMNQMQMMNMGVNMGMGMNMMPFGNSGFNQQGYNGMMGMGINNGQPGNFGQMPMQMPMGMGMPMQMGMGMMPFNNNGMGFDPSNMGMSMGGYNQQGQGGNTSTDQGQGQGQNGMGMGMNWQGNWQ